MSFIAKNPLTIPKVSKAPSAPIQGARGLFAKEDGWYDIDDSGNERKIISEDDLSAEIPEVVDNLTSTDTDKALSANQGNKLEYSKISYDLAYDEKPGDLDNLVPEADTFYNTTDKWYYTTTRFGNVMGLIRRYIYARNMQPMPLEETDKYNDALQIMIMGEDICKRVRTRHSNSNGSLTYTWSEWHPYLTKAEAFEKLCPHTTISEYPVSITDHLSDESVIDYKIYGNSVQYGTPSPDSPVDIVSVGDLVTDTASEYYGKYDVPVTVTGKNLLNTYGFSAESMINPSSPRVLKNNHGTTISTVNPSDSITITQVYRSNYSLESYLNGYFCVGLNEEIKIGLSYRISFDIDIISNPGNAKDITILINGSSRYNLNLREGRISNSFIYSKNSAYPTRRFIEFRCMGMSFTISNIMITYVENKDIEYEPYTSSNQHIYLDEPLRKVGDYADYIDFKNQKVIRQIEALDDTGAKSIDESFGTFDTPIEGSITVPELTMPNSAVTNISTETAISPSNMDVEYYQDINTVINNLTNAILSQGGNV